jgi:hypothetical protein
MIRGTQAICIVPTWRGPFMLRFVVCLKTRLGTKFLVRGIFQRRGEFNARSTMRNEPPSKLSFPPGHEFGRAASLWTARRREGAARRRNACRSRSAGLYMVRPRFTASAPAQEGRCALSRWQAALRAVEVLRNRRGSGEAVAFKNGVRWKTEQQTSPCPSGSGLKETERWEIV